MRGDVCIKDCVSANRVYKELYTSVQQFVRVLDQNKFLLLIFLKHN